MALNISDNFPLGDFVGQVLIQVAVGPYDLQLHFNRRLKTRPDAEVYEMGGAICIRYGATLLAGATTFYSLDFSDSGATDVARPLLSLLMKPISSVEVAKDNSLLIGFPDNAILSVLVEPQGYESYELSLPEVESAVVTRSEI